MTASGILERHGATSLIDIAIERARDGDASALFFSGSPGLGKSALLDYACESATGFDIGRCCGIEIGTDIAFGILNQVMAHMGASDEIECASRVPNVERLPFAAREFLRWATTQRQRPALLLLDDLHWSDHESLAIFHHYLACRKRAPVSLIGAFRPWPENATTFANSLSRMRRAEILELRPLSAGAARQMVVEHADGELDGAALEEAELACQGNPLLLIHFAKSYRRHPETEHSRARHCEEIPSKPGPNVVTLIGDEPKTVNYARVASVFGAKFPVSVVSQVSGVEARGAIEIVDKLSRWSLLHANGSFAEFTHALVRELIYDSIPELTRREMHRAIFAELHRIGYEPSVMAYHAVCGDLRGNQAAVEAAFLVGDRFWKGGSPATAKTWFETALAQLS